MAGMQRVALITGANKGIGFEISRRLALTGQTVLIGARNRNLGEVAAAKLRAQGFDARFVALDVLDPASIAAAASMIERDFQRLDVLVNNAGIADAQNDGPPSRADAATMRRIMETNFHGPCAVVKAMLPLLRKAPAARIVNVSSSLGSITLHNDPAWIYADYKRLGYSASKAALNMMTVQLAWELRDTPIKVNSADPGYTATDMNSYKGPQTVEEGAAEAVRLALLDENGPTGGFFETAGRRPW